MNAYQQTIHLEDSIFEKMRNDANDILKKLIKNMVEKGTTEGSLSIKADITLKRNWIKDYSENEEGESRCMLTPVVAHKINSVMQLKSDCKGITDMEGMELVYDETEGDFVIKPVADTEQRSIFDSDFTEAGESLSGQKLLGMNEPTSPEMNEDEGCESEDYTKTVYSEHPEDDDPEDDYDYD